MASVPTRDESPSLAQGLARTEQPQLQDTLDSICLFSCKGHLDDPGIDAARVLRPASRGSAELQEGVLLTRRMKASKVAGLQSATIVLLHLDMETDFCSCLRDLR